MTRRTGPTDLGVAMDRLSRRIDRDGSLTKARVVAGDKKIVKVSIVGVGMRSHAGIASRMFRALAAETINIQMISTSEIKISIVVDEKYAELAVRTLHSEFGLAQE